MGLLRMGLPSGTLECDYNKGKQSGTCVWYDYFDVMVIAWSGIGSFTRLMFHANICFSPFAYSLL